MGRGGNTAIDLGKNEYVALLMVASFVEMWAAGTACSAYDDATGSHDFSGCKGDAAYAVATGVISLVFAILLLVIGRFAPGVANGVVEMCLIIPVACLWFVCMAITTMGTAVWNGTANANGYFCTWLATVVSWFAVLEYSPMITGLVSKATATAGADETKSVILFIACSSFIEMWCAAKNCAEASDGTISGAWAGQNGCPNGMYRWGVTVGVVSTVIALVWGLVPPLASSIKFVAIFLATWWITAIVTLTMNNHKHPGPQNAITAGNYYFAVWFSTFSSIYLCALAWDLTSSGGAAEGEASEPQVEAPQMGDTTSEPIPEASNLEAGVNPAAAAADEAANEDTAKV